MSEKIKLLQPDYGVTIISVLVIIKQHVCDCVVSISSVMHYVDITYLANYRDLNMVVVGILCKGGAGVTVNVD